MQIFCHGEENGFQDLSGGRRADGKAAEHQGVHLFHLRPGPFARGRSDAVLWDLTTSENKGIVPLPRGSKADLWAEFRYAPVNEGNKPLSQSKGVELVNEINQTDEAGTVDAILKSVRADR